MKQLKRPTCSKWVTILLFVAWPSLANIPAYPEFFEDEQPDGSVINVKIEGNLFFNYLVDPLGYPVVEEDGYFMYATYNNETGELSATNFPVGSIDDPAEVGIAKRYPSLPSSVNNSSSILDPIKSNQDLGNHQLGGPREKLYSNAKIKNLVVLMCFSDHTKSLLPHPMEYDLLFNSVGPNRASSSGSVRDVFERSSYGNLDMESYIYPWIELSKTESYYADGNAGSSERLQEAMVEALEIINRNFAFNWRDFDTDGNGKIDAITFLHSGFGAEFGGKDCRGRHWKNRIWSHMYKFDKAWRSRLNLVRVRDYQIASGLWGRDSTICRYDIMHIGVVSHELGHYLGLTDQYGGEIGVGIGSYGLMGNAWGVDFTQKYPPMMSPYNKISLGWMTAIDIEEPGTYSLKASHSSPKVYKISTGFGEGEYLLLENRQPKFFDKDMPQGGLLIWHIDEYADEDIAGHPNQNNWPENGKHYRNALLQADGRYDLEQALNYGDRMDPFHANGVNYIGPDGIDGITKQKYPNTNSYSKGKAKPTGYVIDQISYPGEEMSFRLSKASKGFGSVNFDDYYEPLDDFYLSTNFDYVDDFSLHANERKNSYDIIEHVVGVVDMAAKRISQLRVNNDNGR